MEELQLKGNAQLGLTASQSAMHVGSDPLLLLKLQSKTWKGVVKKNKFDLPENHENKIGVGTNSATNRIVTPNGTVLPNTASASASALGAARHVSKSFKTSTFK